MSENKKFTSNEIINALKRCFCDDGCHASECPFFHADLDAENQCVDMLMKSALNLINNLLNENEDLAEQLCCLDIECERLEKANESQRVEIERYKETVGELGIKDGEVVALLNGKGTKYIQKDVAETLKRMAVKTAKVEAIKEYHTKVKRRLLGKGFYPAMVKCVLNEVEKEMVGDA